MANPQYICSLPSHFILSLSLYPYPFPSHSLTISPISLSIHFHFPHFPLSLNPFPIFPTLAAHSVYPLSHSFLPSPSILQSRTIHIHQPYTLCHTFSPYPPILALVPTLYALVSIFSRSLALPPITHPCIFHMKHINNNSYFHFHIIYYIILYYMYLCPLHIVSTCLL